MIGLSVCHCPQKIIRSRDVSTLVSGHCCQKVASGENATNLHFEALYKDFKCCESYLFLLVMSAYQPHLHRLISYATVMASIAHDQARYNYMEWLLVQQSNDLSNAIDPADWRLGLLDLL